MAKFGKYAILDPVTFHFEKEEKWWWKLVPPTAGDELALRKFYTEGRVTYGPDGVRREYFPNLFEQSMREIALCFGGTNIPVDDEKPVEEGGDPILKVGASIEAIEKVLRDMPPEMVMEIWDNIGKSIPGWGPIIEVPNEDPNSKGSK